MATQTKITMAELDAMDFNEILGLRFCDFDWSLAQLPAGYREGIEESRRECELKRLDLVPKFYVAKEWLSPEDCNAVGIPFYLMHEKLLAIETEFKSTAEGSSPTEFLQLVRHEIGHCFDHAHGLSLKRDFARTFGSPARDYAPEFYRPDANSKDYVSHLPGYYAQAHPLEDFAETFAVWLDPLSNWRRRYARRPVALGKLHFIESKVEQYRGKRTVLNAPLMGEAQKSVMPLSLHYKRQLALVAKIRAHATME